MDVDYSFQIALKKFLTVYWVQFCQIENSVDACKCPTQNFFQLGN